MITIIIMIVVIIIVMVINIICVCLNILMHAYVFLSVCIRIHMHTFMIQDGFHQSQWVNMSSTICSVGYSMLMLLCDLLILVVKAWSIVVRSTELSDYVTMMLNHD